MDTLLTGASGFLGKYIFEQLQSTHNVQTIGRSEINSINHDLTTGSTILPQHFNLVVHAAGKAHSIPKTELQRRDFFDVNVNGTKNLLESLDKSGVLPKSFVLISSVAVYGLDKGTLISEETPLLASDPYGLSKIEAEKLVAAWCLDRNITFSILRLPLVVGSKPPGNLKAMINGIKKGYYFNIGQANARKSMVLASDVAEIVTYAAEVGGTYNLTDNHHPSFLELSTHISKALGKTAVPSIPVWLAKIMAYIGDILGDSVPINSVKLMKIRSNLTFDNTKVKTALNWKPVSVLSKIDEIVNH